MTNPWWYSGDEADDPSRKAPTVDLGMLASGAQALVELARGTLFASHADHGVAGDHPTCLLCRAQVLLGTSEGGSADLPAHQRRIVQWLPIEE